MNRAAEGRSADSSLSGGGDLQPAEHSAAAIECCREALAADPNCAEAYYRLGCIYQNQGWPEKAAICFREAAAIDPADERFSFSLGWALQGVGCHDEAAEWYAHTLRTSPGCVAAWYNLGVLHLEHSRHAEAASAFEQALSLQPQFAEALNNLGITLLSLERRDCARACFESAIRLKPEYAEAHANLGRFMFEQARWDGAAAAFRRALKIRPDHIEALHNLGLCHHKMRRLEAAEACYRRVLELSPDHHQALLNMGNIRLDRGDLEEMAHWYRKALSRSQPSAEACVNVGRMLQNQGRLDEALTCYDQALGIDHGHADAHFSRATVLLQTGYWKEGWQEYEWRFRKANWRAAYPYRLPGRRWQGQDFSGQTLLIHCEQGFGDAIQFCRFLPLVKARGGRVVLEAPAALAGIFRSLAGVDHILGFSSKAMTTYPFDLHAPLLSLPGILGTTPENIPAGVPYLLAPPEKEAFWKPRMAGREFQVGIVWASSGWNKMLAEKSCGLASFRPIADMDGIRMIGLQKGGPSGDAQSMAGMANFVNLGEEFADFGDTAAVIEHLDLVLTVDTAVAHLAGAMGKPVWVVLPFEADWRWQVGREDSPWYPTMRLYRQTRTRNWQEVFLRVAADLHALTHPPGLQVIQAGIKRDS
jgi:tetratricopeptide (TPR) repeat protein